MLEIPEQKVLKQIANLAAEEGEEPLPIAKIAAVFAAYKNVMEGDPIGMMRRDPMTGNIALRVSAEGLHMWKVSCTNGDIYNDLQPTLDWPVLQPAGESG